MRRAPERRRVRFWKFFRRERKGICRARRRVKRPGPAYGSVLLGDPALPAWQSGPRNELRLEPFDAYSLAVACGGRGVPLDTCPASHSARRPLAPPRYGTRHRIAPPSRTRPRATACRHLHARLFARPARSPARRSAMAVGESPPFARDRDVALGALAARRPRCRAIAARHVGHLPVPSHAGHFVRQRPHEAASECGGLYHPVINPALTACLADP